MEIMGDERERGIEIEVEEIKEKGGVKGEKIVMVRGEEVDKNKEIGEESRMI